METQYWANVAWQENANANIANGKPTLGQYIHVAWGGECLIPLGLNYNIPSIPIKGSYVGLLKILKPHSYQTIQQP